MAVSAIPQSNWGMSTLQQSFRGQYKLARTPLVTANKRRVVTKAAAADDAAPSPSDDYHLTADTILWNAKHSAILRMRIAQVRAAEVVAESSSSRPELPPVNEITTNDVRQNHSSLSQWHEDQWQRLGATQHTLWDDELGHFGAPS
ncbi:hypothetical protein VaNZ11_014258 [Volvox africanus]|uniref:Uncharacterized protein n=1 Tax=Volvox africanus TaxID=51714 RepID=A0ABQ5SIY3_9CHLO|nr:hypothetical protein VaNZ11_014258 [Volvox africanus]